MPSSLTYPGVYVEELPSGVRTITGVPTSLTAFVGRAWRGPLDEPTKINSYSDYERSFGGLWRGSTMSYAVQQFFSNGGSQAIVVRVATRSGVGAAAAATIDLGGGNTLAAAFPGTWGRNLSVTVDHKVKTPADASLFNLTILDDPNVATAADSQKRGGSGAQEAFLNVSRDPASARFVTKIIAQQSNLVRVTGVGAATPADATVKAGAATGADGVSTTTVAAAAAEVTGDALAKTGINALRKTDIFNLLVIPPLTTSATATDTPTTTNDVPMANWTDAANLCKERRAFLIVDAPSDWTIAKATTDVGTFSAIERSYAGLYFPRLRIADPLQEGGLQDFAPSGAIAGIMSRTDAERGVWKAPAGLEAGLRGVLGLSINGLPATLTDKENGDLNPIGVNCLRAFPNIGHVVWGARTLEGSDILASQWKYIPVRRLALYIEESLFRGTQWVVFEPNDEPLWAQIRLNLGAFMQTLFRQGAFQGTTAKDAYLVKCDKETTTQDDINRGVVNILVGFAPLKPAEFVVIKIQQLAGQVQS
ncbi:MAG: phage tail sheath C-terminal domain-containing protein [Gemmatimonadaceae bacterium]